MSVWLGIVNGLLAEGWLARQRPWALFGYVSAATLTVLVISVHGHWAIERSVTRESNAAPARVLLGHAGTPFDDEQKNGDEVVPALRARTLELQGTAPPDLVVWPETVVNGPTAVERLPALARDYLLRDRVQGASAPTLRATLLVGPTLEQKGELFNSAALVRYPGLVLGHYDKVALVPLGESGRIFPGVFELGPGVPGTTRFTKGRNVEPLRVAGHPIAVSICYEDLLPERIRQDVLKSSAELLVNLTSDAWFRDSDAGDLHLAAAKLRAVEQRKYLLRATRDGATAVIDSAGRVRQKVVAPNVQAILAEARWLPGFTVYARHGSTWITVLVAISVVIAGLRTHFRPRGTETG